MVALVSILALGGLGVLGAVYSKDTTILIGVAGLIGTIAGYSYGVSKIGSPGS
jgi:hypothetical protein